MCREAGAEQITTYILILLNYVQAKPVGTWAGRAYNAERQSMRMRDYLLLLRALTSLSRSARVASEGAGERGHRFCSACPRQGSHVRVADLSGVCSSGVRALRGVRAALR